MATESAEATVLANATVVGEVNLAKSKRATTVAKKSLRASQLGFA